MGVRIVSYTGKEQIIGASDGYITLSGTTEIYSSDVDLCTDGYSGAHIIIEVNFDGTPTNDVDVALYGSLDGTDYDDISVWGQRIDNGTDPCQMSITVKDLAHFRIGAKQTGSTDTHDVRAYLKRFF